MQYNSKEKEFLLNLAREAIKSELSGFPLNITSEEIPAKLKEKRACFVTLTIDDKLRGCIGSLTPSRTLYQDVIENAKNAAFDDPRFLPLNAEEFDKIKIEISILELPQKYLYSSVSELINYLGQNKPGVVLSKGNYQATFLPQVWEELPDPADFMAHLCLKAGLSPDEWQNRVEIETYAVEKMEETNI